MYEKYIYKSHHILPRLSFVHGFLDDAVSYEDTLLHYCQHCKFHQISKLHLKDLPVVADLENFYGAAF
jgi:hypothetical protein